MTVVDRAFERASDQFSRAVASIEQGSWGNPTVCEVPVRELVEHVVAGNEFAVRLLGGASADGARAGIDRVRVRAEPIRQVKTSCAAQARAFSEADRGRLLPHPSGDIDYDAFVCIRLGELVVHSWDIAVATSPEPASMPRLDPAAVADLWHRMQRHRDRMRQLGSYGDGRRPALAAGASLQERLLDAFGRRADGAC